MKHFSAFRNQAWWGNLLKASYPQLFYVQISWLSCIAVTGTSTNQYYCRFIVTVPPLLLVQIWVRIKACKHMHTREIFNKWPWLNINCIVLHVVSRNISEKQWIALGLITLAGCFNRSVIKSPPFNLICVWRKKERKEVKKGEEEKAKGPKVGREG